MKKNYFIVYFFFIYQICYSQNWECIKTNGNYYYLGNNTGYPSGQGKAIKIIHIDSIRNINGDSIFYVPPTIRPIYQFGECYSPEGASWIGRYVIKNQNGDYFFFNTNNDTIKIKSLAEINDSWLCYKDSNNLRITAKISSVVPDTFLGISDSVKLISFLATDSLGDSLSNPVNSLHLLLSKTYGFIDILNFNSFPGLSSSYMLYTEEFSQYNIVGKSNPDVGITNFTFHEVYDFDIGDEFYYVGLDENMMLSYPPYYSHYSYVLDKIVDKDVYIQGDSVVYTVDRCYKYVNTDSGITTITKGSYIGKRRIYFNNLNNVVFDHMPDEVVFDTITNNRIYTLAFYPSYQNRTCKIVPSEYCQAIFNNNDSSWCIPIIDACLIDAEYVYGCGGPYGGCNYYGYTNYYYLSYYKKGFEIYGNPMTCNVLLGIDEPWTEDGFFEIFPNPFSDKTTIKISNENFHPYTLEIYNIFGQRLRKIKNINSSVYTIERNNLPAGIYFYSVIVENNTYSGKLVIE